MPNIEISTITVPIGGIPTALSLKGSGGGSSIEVNELTYLEYLALSTADRNNGSLYFVTDYSPGTARFEVTSLPNKVYYDDSDDGVSNVYSSSGLAIVFTDQEGYSENVTSSCNYTIAPEGGTAQTLTNNFKFPSNPTEDSIAYTITASYSLYGGTTYTTSFEVELGPDIAHEEPSI